MNRFYYSNICFNTLIFICITINSSFGQQSKITVWPAKEPEFADEDNDNIRGMGGKDYPIYSSIPRTSFTCNGQLPGFYADEETNCQVFHLCNNNLKISFLCGNGTIFNQKLFTCNWWYNTTCSDSHKYYILNAELYKEKKNENKKLSKIENKNSIIDNNKNLSPKTRLPQLSPLIPNKRPQEVIRQNVGQSVGQNFRQNTGQSIVQNMGPTIGQIVGQNAEQSVGQNIGKSIEQNMGQTIGQTVGQITANKEKSVEVNDPIVRHIVLTDNKETDSDGIESDYEQTLPENNENVYEILE